MPPIVTPITSAADLNKPVVAELSNANVGAAAVPSAILAVNLDIVDAVAVEIIPPLNVANPVNVDVDCAANTSVNVPVVPLTVVNIAPPLDPIL